MTQYCSYCGNELAPNAKFCGNCGQAVAAMPQEEGPSPQAPPSERRRRGVGAPWNAILVVSVVLAVSLVGVAAWLGLTRSGEEEEAVPAAPTWAAAGAVGATGTPGATASPRAKVSPTPPGAGAASVDDDPYLGPMDAPVTIIEFSDFECPYCKRFRDETLDQLLQAYEGKIRFVFRDFPVHGESAVKMAEAAECAHDQDRFWEYHDKLFSNQSALDVASLKSYASDLGLDAAVFNDCLDTGKHTAEVQKDSQDAQTLGVNGVPTFFINGVLIEGAQPFSAFQQVIDAALIEEG
jgi:protein-disulfide isomerase